MVLSEHAPGHIDLINALSFSPDGQILASASDRLRRIRVNGSWLWRVSMGYGSDSSRSRRRHVRRRLFARRPDLVPASDKAVKIWRSSDALCSATLGHGFYVGAVAISGWAMIARAVMCHPAVAGLRWHCDQDLSGNGMSSPLAFPSGQTLVPRPTNAIICNSGEWQTARCCGTTADPNGFAIVASRSDGATVLSASGIRFSSGGRVSDAPCSRVILAKPARACPRAPNCFSPDGRLFGFGRQMHGRHWRATPSRERASLDRDAALRVHLSGGYSADDAGRYLWRSPRSKDRTAEWPRRDEIRRSS